MLVCLVWALRASKVHHYCTLLLSAVCSNMLTTVVFMVVLSNLAFSSMAIIMISCVCICQFDSNSASGRCVGLWVCEGVGP